MGDIDRSQPLNHNYDHTDGSFSVRKTLSDLYEKAKAALPSMPKQGGEQKHLDPNSGAYKTNMDIADSES